MTRLKVRGAASSAQAETVSSEGDGDYVIGPEYTLDPDLTDRGNPKGRLFEFTMPLAESRYFKGDDATLEPDRKPGMKGAPHFRICSGSLSRWREGTLSGDA